MPWRVEFTPNGARQFKKLERPVREAIANGLKRLIAELEADAPTLTNVKKLVGGEQWRLRIGDYRVVFQSAPSVLFVTVIRVGHRRDIYRER
ncbi:MAG TPA: type II toxin-antitoxin system RelE/ParE family toxin [Oscillatoriaceae cyanobacterium]